MNPLTVDMDVPYVAHAGETHRMRVYRWGAADAPPVLCIHGLTRNARDFDFLAQALAARFHVIAVDMPGRGRSEWLAHKQEYGVPFYLANLQFILQQLGIARMRWVGTSMGGILGMAMAAHAPGMIEKLVLNDIGGSIPGSALARLGGYVGKRAAFSTRTAGEAALREIYAPFGIREEHIWQHIFTHSLEALPNGTARLAYDPALGEGMNTDAAQPDMHLWEMWDKVTCPVLVVRGGESDILTQETTREMQRRTPGMRLYTVPGAGHAPMLADAGEIAAVAEFLR